MSSQTTVVGNRDSSLSQEQGAKVYKKRSSFRAMSDCLLPLTFSLLWLWCEADVDLASWLGWHWRQLHLRPIGPDKEYVKSHRDGPVDKSTCCQPCLPGLDLCHMVARSSFPLVYAHSHPPQMFFKKYVRQTVVGYSPEKTIWTRV